MTRPIVALFLALASAVAACDGDDEEAARGMLAGFAPAEDGALVVPPTDCGSTLGIQVSALLIGFSTFTNLCGYVQATGLCGEVASSTILTVSVVRGRAGLPPAPIGPGTYAISETPTLELDGSAVAAAGAITKTGAAPGCVEPDAYPGLTGGSLVLTAVDEVHAAGTIDVSFDDGSRFQASFDAPLCSFAIDLCDLLADAPSCTAPVCCPTSTTCPPLG